MNEQNKRLRDKLLTIERIAVNTLANQPQGDDNCGEYLKKAISDIGSEVGVGISVNAAAMREAMKAVKKRIDGMCSSPLDYDPMIPMSSLKPECDRLSARIDSAISAPPRNCDRSTNKEWFVPTFIAETGKFLTINSTDKKIVEWYDAFFNWLFDHAKNGGTV